MQLCRGGRTGAEGGEEWFKALTPLNATEFIECFAYGDPVKPAGWELLIPLPFQENSDCEFLRAGLVVDDAANDAGNAPKVGFKEILEILSRASGGAHCVHNSRTIGMEDLWQVIWGRLPRRSPGRLRRGLP